MLFNSLDFAVFLTIVFFIYWFPLKEKRKSQNVLLLIASYIFYGWWDWRFLSLIILSSIVDYTLGLLIDKTKLKVRKKILLSVSLVVNLSLLCVFKYLNFFIDSFSSAFSFFGQDLSIRNFNVILPVGISFYTFQTLSYTIDVYKGKLKPTNDIISFFAFVSFFPQLVAGPIERASNLLPQFNRERKFDYDSAVDGVRQILWGLVKKVLIADNCAKIVNIIFGNYESYNGSTLLYGAVLFSFQIYGDFSGYSDIAIGVSKLFGFNLMKNFSYPYFSRDIAEFWRRWHISLSTWFRDYLYIPLGGSRGTKIVSVRNTLVIFLVSGFWHGANWTFIVWGGLNALYFMPSLLFNTNRKNLGGIANGRFLPTFYEAMQILKTFLLTNIAWIFFRSSSIKDAMNYISGIFNMSFFSKIEEFDLRLIVLLVIFILVEWIQRNNDHGLSNINTIFPVVPRYFFYYIIVFLLLYVGGNQQDFIYFQF